MRAAALLLALVVGCGPGWVKVERFAEASSPPQTPASDGGATVRNWGAGGAFADGRSAGSGELASPNDAGSAPDAGADDAPADGPAPPDAEPEPPDAAPVDAASSAPPPGSCELGATWCIYECCSTKCIILPTVEIDSGAVDGCACGDSADGGGCADDQVCTTYVSAIDGHRFSICQ